MTKFRIKVVRDYDLRILYVPQYRIFGIWLDTPGFHFDEHTRFRRKEDAEEFIAAWERKLGKDKVIGYL